MNYDLIVSDFDGTLRRDDGSVGERTQRAIANFTAKGGIFTVCTGRMTSSVLPIARKLGLKGPVVSFQGSTIADIETGKILFEHAFPFEDALFVLETMESLGYRVHFYSPTEFYTNYEGEELSWYESVVGVKGKRISHLSSFLREHPMPIIKILTMVRAEDKLHVFETLKEKLGAKYYVTYSAACLVEVALSGCDKGTAVKFLADYYHIPLEKTMSFGDNFNDVPMILTAGLGVAVANAADSLKEVAPLVSEYTNNEDAVGRTIEEYVREETR